MNSSYTPSVSQCIVEIKKIIDKKCLTTIPCTHDVYFLYPQGYWERETLSIVELYASYMKYMDADFREKHDVVYKDLLRMNPPQYRPRTFEDSRKILELNDMFKQLL